MCASSLRSPSNTATLDTHSVPGVEATVSHCLRLRDHMIVIIATPVGSRLWVALSISYLFSGSASIVVCKGAFKYYVIIVHPFLDPPPPPHDGM